MTDSILDENEEIIPSTKITFSKGVTSLGQKIYSKYIFVLFIVFVCLMGVTTLTGLSSLNSYNQTLAEMNRLSSFPQDLYQLFLSLRPLIVVELLLIILVLGVAIFGLVFSAGLRKRALSIASKAQLVKYTSLQLIASIAFLVVISIYTIFEIYAVSRSIAIYTEINNSYGLGLVSPDYVLPSIRLIAVVGLSIPMVIIALHNKHAVLTISE